MPGSGTRTLGSRCMSCVVLVVRRRVAVYFTCCTDRFRGLGTQGTQKHLEKSTVPTSRHRMLGTRMLNDRRHASDTVTLWPWNSSRAHVWMGAERQLFGCGPAQPSPRIRSRHACIGCTQTSQAAVVHGQAAVHVRGRLEYSRRHSCFPMQKACARMYSSHRTAGSVFPFFLCVW